MKKKKKTHRGDTCGGRSKRAVGPSYINIYILRRIVFTHNNSWRVEYGTCRHDMVKCVYIYTRRHTTVMCVG